jgi:predicted flap endonuclease-1-like 5' DNA nuclease
MRIVLIALVSLAILVVGFLAGLVVGGVGPALGSFALFSVPLLVAGFCVAWVVEWIIDNQRRRLREERHRQVLAQATRSDGVHAEVSRAAQAVEDVRAEQARLAQTVGETLLERQRLAQMVSDALAERQQLANVVNEALAERQRLAEAIEEVLADREHLGQAVDRALAERDREIGGLRSDLDVQQARYDQLKAVFEDYVDAHPDDLTQIKGIGSAYQDRLRSAGYRTYARLAQADVQELRRALEIKMGRAIDLQSWIDQAEGLV